MKRRPVRLTFHNKMVLIFSLILLGATLMVGMFGFFIAKKSLDEKGSEILKNSVQQAMELIQVEYDHEENGDLTLDDAQEKVKNILIGPKNSDGTRTKTSNIYLGKYGYFIVYNSEGYEVMHPTLEGEYVWNTKDPKDASRYIVQETIEIAKNGGGYLEYNWALPYQNDIGNKLVYAEYFAAWDWIVVATSYTVDFNASANNILIIMLGVILVVFIMIVYIFNGIIRYLTTPIALVVNGMDRLAAGKYQKVEVSVTENEINHLIHGYNNMIDNLENAQQDIKKKNNEIVYLAYHDDMTKLLNLYGLQNYVDSTIKNGIKDGALILVNINGLSTINAIYSYGKGNEYIADIALFLTNRRHEFYSARTKSNEFALWVELDNKDVLQNKLQHLKQDLYEFSSSIEYAKSVEYLFAVAYYGEHGECFSDLYEKTTIAMRIKKENQIEGIILYSDKMRAEMSDKFTLTLKIANAFECNEFVPFYQEKRDSLTNEVVGVEVLVRWINEQNGIVSPSVFLPVIHEQNLTSRFTEYMLDHALSEYHLLTEKYGKEINISINIFPTNLFGKSIIPYIKELLIKYSIPPERLILEITEEIFITKIDEVKEITNTIRQMGIKISIDDFGTGYSSLKYLADIEFDELKMDKSFIDRILTDERVFELIKIITRIASVYDYKLVAEGVETKEQLEKLESIGVHIIQGYLFSRPEPLKKP